MGGFKLKLKLEIEKMSNFFGLGIVQTFNLLAAYFGWSFFTVYFYELGYSISEMIFSGIFYSLTPIIVILFSKRISSRTAMNIGILFRALAIFFCYKFIFNYLGHTQLFLVNSLIGLMSVYYWLSNYAIIQKEAKTNNRAFIAMVFSSIDPLVSMIAPLISAWIIEKNDYAIMFNVALGFTVFALFSTKLVKKEVILDFNIKKIMKQLKHLKTLTFIQGVFSGLNTFTIGLITISFVKSLFDYGVFASMTAVFGIVASLLLGRWSDKIRNRVVFAKFSLIITGVLTFLSSFSTNYTAWIISRSFYGFFIGVAFPFVFTIVGDCIENKEDGMVARNLLMNFGAVIGSIISLLIFYLTNNLMNIVVVSSFMLFLMAFLVQKNSKHYALVLKKPEKEIIK